VAGSKEVDKTVTRKTTIAATPARAKKRSAARRLAAKAIETVSKDRSQPRFAPIRTKRVFEEICEQVRREMAAGSLRPGDKLPPERELALKLGVSRAAVREALRSLEIAGVVGLHKGARGGAFILKGDPDLVTRSIRDMFHLGRISLDNLTEARTLVMQVAMQLACERIRPTTVAALEKNVDRLTTLPASGKASERVAVRRLDSLRQDLVRPNDRVYLKLDVQGLELDALRGAEKTCVCTARPRPPRLIGSKRCLPSTFYQNLRRDGHCVQGLIRSRLSAGAWRRSDEAFDVASHGCQHSPWVASATAVKISSTSTRY